MKYSTIFVQAFLIMIMMLTSRSSGEQVDQPLDKAGKSKIEEENSNSGDNKDNHDEDDDENDDRKDSVASPIGADISTIEMDKSSQASDLETTATEHCMTTCVQEEDILTHDEIFTSQQKHVDPASIVMKSNPIVESGSTLNISGIFFIPGEIPFSGPDGDLVVQWKTFRVAKRCIPLLDKIVEKYPTILEHFSVRTAGLQASYLGTLALIVHIMSITLVRDVGSGLMNFLQSSIMDLRIAHIDSNWIQDRVDALRISNGQHELFELEGQLTKEEKVLVELETATIAKKLEIAKIKDSINSLRTQLDSLRQGLDPSSTIL
ncbi:hypothetical protein ACH5RR_034079 [Cinchona calisaya]|uniref:Uncharacterized protein n=1 Tax=Cinchona calisaya TaxID=153742 RepID=A0ABD2Y9U1_9GENT